MANQKNNSLPVMIIGIVLIAGLGAGWYFYANSKPQAPNTNINKSVNGNTNKPVQAANVSPGAQPPNMTGSERSTVTIEEFADFQCPTCASMHPVMNEVKSVYGSRIKFIYRNFPLNIPQHDKSYEASVAAEAAGSQGKFWEMQNLLFANQSTWTANPGYKQIWNEYAQKLGLDVVKFQNDMAGIGAKSRVDADLMRGRGLNVNSTPSIFINGVLVEPKDFNITNLKAIIDAELQKTASSSNQAPAAAPAANAANTSGTNSNK